jgi:hypothetical protein
MWKSTKYAAIAIVGAGLAVAANASASAHGYKGGYYGSAAYAQPYGHHISYRHHISGQFFRHKVLHQLARIGGQNRRILVALGERPTAYGRAYGAAYARPYMHHMHHISYMHRISYTHRISRQFFRHKVLHQLARIGGQNRRILVALGEHPTAYGRAYGRR